MNSFSISFFPHAQVLAFKRKKEEAFAIAFGELIKAFTRDQLACISSRGDTHDQLASTSPGNSLVTSVSLEFESPERRVYIGPVRRGRSV